MFSRLPRCLTFLSRAFKSNIWTCINLYVYETFEIEIGHSDEIRCSIRVRALEDLNVQIYLGA